MLYGSSKASDFMWKHFIHNHKYTHNIIMIFCCFLFLELQYTNETQPKNEEEFPNVLIW